MLVTRIQRLSLGCLAGWLALQAAGVQARPQSVASGPSVRPPRSAPPGVTRPGVPRKLEQLQKEAVFEVQGTPDWSVVTPDSVWVSSARANAVVKLDSGSNRRSLIAEVKRPCSGLAEGFGSIWVPSCGDHAIVRIDPSTGRAQASITADPADSEGGITVGAGSVWFVSKGGHLLRINPDTNAVIGTVDLPPGAANPRFGGESIWVTSFDEGRLLRVDPRAMKLLASVAVGAKPRFLTVGDGSVWTLNQGDGTVTRVDLNTATVKATIPCGLTGSGGEMAFGEGRVWATLFDIPLTEIDPATNRVTKQWFGSGGDGLSVGLGSIWLSNLRQGTVWRISPHQD